MFTLQHAGHKQEQCCCVMLLSVGQTCLCEQAVAAQAVLVCDVALEWQPLAGACSHARRLQQALVQAPSGCSGHLLMPGACGDCTRVASTAVRCAGTCCCVAFWLLVRRMQGVASSSQQTHAHEYVTQALVSHWLAECRRFLVATLCRLLSAV